MLEPREVTMSVAPRTSAERAVMCETMTIAGLAYSQATTVVVVTYDLSPRDRVLRLADGRRQATSGSGSAGPADGADETTGAP